MHFWLWLQGRGLGRMFLRHLRRTTGMLHVLDGSAGVSLCPAFNQAPGLVDAHCNTLQSESRGAHTRTQALHAAAVDPLDDYRVVREELRLYNPEYCTRPHVVALNKCDMFESPSNSSHLVAQLQDLATQLQVSLRCYTDRIRLFILRAEDLAWAERSRQCWRQL